MNKVKRLSFLFVLSLIFSLSFSCLSYGAKTYYYATTDMTWAEFYAAEVESTVDALETAGLDAYTNPTTRMFSSFPVSYDLVSNDTTHETTYTGIKGARVRMTEAVYNALTDKSRYDFVDEAFTTDYKDLNADGTFGKMVTETTTSDVDVSLLSGTSTRWGNYVLEPAENVNGMARGATSTYLGAVITTSDGTKYGMRHANNIWTNSEVALTYEEGFTEAHGYPREYKYTSDIEGKTVTGITYMLLDSPDVVLSGLNVYLKEKSDTTVEAAGGYISAGKDVAVKFVLTDEPDDADYSVATFSKGEWVENLRHGQPGWKWNALTKGTDYTYTSSDQTIVISGDVASGDYYQAVFKSEKYADINTYFYAYDTKYATTNMTFAEFYAGEIGSSDAELKAAGLDAFTNPTTSVSNPSDTRHYLPLLSSDMGTSSSRYGGLKNVPVRMTEDVYNALSTSDKARFTLSDDFAFTEFKEVSSDLTFGKMVNTATLDGGTPTLSSGSSARWGNYVIVPSNVTVDRNKYYGAVLETKDGKKYGLRPNANIWSNNNVAICYEEFVEPHGVTRPYEYTKDLEGKTVTSIRYMLVESPDVVVSCDLYLKKSTTATVTPKYSDGYNAINIASANANVVSLDFANVPSDTTYSLSGVSFGSGKSARAVNGCTFTDGVLTISGDIQVGSYTATFTSDEYADISATIKYFTSIATDLLISGDANNPAELIFMLTPEGMIDSVDETLEDNKFVNASDYTIKADNKTALYTDEVNAVEGSGFSFDIVISEDKISDDYRAIVGFSKQFWLTPENLGTTAFNTFATEVKKLTQAEGFYIIMGNKLKDLGLKVKSVLPDDSLRDVTEYLGSGAMISDDTHIMLFFGAMVADCDSGDITEGRYTLSDEGEMLFADGKADYHLTVTWYLEQVEAKSSPDTTDQTEKPEDNGYHPVTPKTESEFNTEDIKLDITDATTKAKVKNAVVEALKNNTNIKVNENIDVVILSVDKVNIESVTSRDSATDDAKKYVASQDQQITVVLPIVKVLVSNIYVFHVSLDQIPVGYPIFWQSMVQDVNNGSFVAADDSSSEAVFFNSEGVSVDKVPADKAVDVAAYLEAGKTYAPLITTKAAGSSSEEDENENGGKTPGSSGSGCNSFAFAPVMLLGLAIILRKK